MTRAVSLRIGLAWLVAIGAAGCLGKSPQQQYYTLSAATASATPPLASLPALGVAVGPVEFPRYLDRPEIVTRDGAHGLVLSNVHRWAGSIRGDLVRVLAGRIGHLVGTERIASYPNEVRFPIDYRVALEVLAFEGTLGGDVVLRARWVIAAGTTGEALSVEESEIREPTGAPSYADLVAVEGRAVERLGDAIAARLAALGSPERRSRAAGPRAD